MGITWDFHPLIVVRGPFLVPVPWYDIGKELLNTFDDRSLDAIDVDLSSCASDEGRMTELQKFIEERTLAEEHLVPWQKTL